MKTFLFLCGIVGIGILMSGCTNYQLGRPNAPLQERIWVLPVKFEVSIADMAVPLNREIREALIGNTAYVLASSRDQADFLLETVVVDRAKTTLARRSDDSGLSDVLGVELAVRFDLKNRQGDSIKTGSIAVRGQLFRDEGFSESSRQRMPSMVRDLAREIVQAAFVAW
jgi:hypothetical protein